MSAVELTLPQGTYLQVVADQVALDVAKAVWVAINESMLSNMAGEIEPAADH